MLQSRSLTHNQQLFLYWVLEREAVRISKESGNIRPWSKDEVFQTTYFCNIDREDDKVTRWIRENYKYDSYTKTHYIVTIFIARVFNRIETLQKLYFPYDHTLDSGAWYDKVLIDLEDMAFDGETIWGNAYMTTTHGIKMDKAEYYIMCFKELQAKSEELNDCKTLSELHSKLITFRGISSFMSGQIIADVKNTKDHPLNLAIDWDDFCCYGPGSLRGLSWFWDKKISKESFREAINKSRDIVFPRLIDEIKDKLCMQNFQNCFCEYDKYMRVHKNEGRSKRKYKGY